MKSKIYTKTGDKGLTSLVSGTRVSKGSERLNLYGTVDELNAHLGFAIVLYQKELPNDINLKLLHEIQSSLFDLGSNLACESDKREKYKLPQIPSDFIEAIELEIDELDSKLEPIRNFILPGGSEASAYFQVVRTITRKVERALINFGEYEMSELPMNSLIFLNRLSDYFFIVSRYINHLQKLSEIKWIPKK